MAAGLNPEGQLLKLFHTCNLDSNGNLNSFGLKQLCLKLQLGSSVKLLLNNIWRQRNKEKYDDSLIEFPEGISFSEFKDAFIQLLSRDLDENFLYSLKSKEENLDFSGYTNMNKYSESKEILLEQEDKGGNQHRQNLHSGDSSSLIYSSSHEEYLRETWQDLNVGKDGFLTLAELEIVCHHAVGMEKVSSEVIEQLFSKLDVDGDGKISFEEFLHLFQGGGGEMSLSNAMTADEQNSDQFPDEVECLSLCDGFRNAPLFSDSFVFSQLDENKSGFTKVPTLLELWESFGIDDGRLILKDLGLQHRQHERIKLETLFSSLVDVCLPRSGERRPVQTPLDAAALVFIQEMKCLKGVIESTKGERSKLRADLNGANQRLTLLAQELDEHSANMEKRHSEEIKSLERHHRDQVRALQEQVIQERDLAREKVKQLSKEAMTQGSHFQEEEVRLKSRISALEMDVKRLESENAELSSQILDARHQIQIMEKQVVDVNALKSKQVAEYESFSPHEEEYRSLMETLDRITAENQELRDSNDELLSQLCNLSSKQTGMSNYSLDGSCLGDYIDSPFCPQPATKRHGSVSGSGDESSDEESPRGGKQRRFSRTSGMTVHFVDSGSHDESFMDTSLSSLTKVHTGQSSSPISYSVNQLSLEQSHGKDKSLRLKAKDISEVAWREVLESQYEGLKEELSHMKMKFQKLTEEREQMRQQLQKPEESRLNEILQLCSTLLEKIKRKRVLIKKSLSLPMSGDITPIMEEEEEDRDDKSLVKNAAERLVKLIKDNLLCMEWEISGLEEYLNRELEQAEKQRATFEEHCNKLENELEGVRSELSNSEDYWTLKLQEEQEYYEEERKLYDEKFSALEKKIKEYDELIVSDENRIMSKDVQSCGMLNSDAWQEKVTNLEEEISFLRNQVAREIAEKISAIAELENRLSDEMKLAEKERNCLQEQIFSISSQFKLAQDQNSSVINEYEKLKRESSSSIEQIRHKLRQKQGCINNITKNPLHKQLKESLDRAGYLETSLKRHQLHTFQILKMTRDQHKTEVQSLETMLANHQQIFSQQIAKYKDQVTESRQKSAEERGRLLQMATFNGGQSHV